MPQNEVSVTSRMAQSNSCFADVAGGRLNKRALLEAGLFQNRKKLRVDRIDGDKTADLATVLKADYAVDLGEEGIVLAAANVQAGLERCATLTNEDRAASNGFAAEALDAEPLCI